MAKKSSVVFELEYTRDSRKLMGYHMPVFMFPKKSWLFFRGALCESTMRVLWNLPEFEEGEKIWVRIGKNKFDQSYECWALGRGLIKVENFGVHPMFPKADYELKKALRKLELEQGESFYVGVEYEQEN